MNNFRWIWVISVCIWIPKGFSSYRRENFVFRLAIFFRSRKRDFINVGEVELDLSFISCSTYDIWHINRIRYIIEVSIFIFLWLFKNFVFKYQNSKNVRAGLFQFGIYLMCIFYCNGELLSICYLCHFGQPYLFNPAFISKYRI